MPIRRRTGLSLLLLIAAGLPAIAADGPQVGVWDGTLGGQPVIACFNNDDSGAYYYRRHLHAIYLEAEDKTPGHWFETADGGDKKTGEWVLSRIEADRIEGQWSNPGGTRRLPVALTRVPANDTDNPACGTSAFNAPLELPPKFTQGKPKALDGKHYRTITARAAQFQVTALELLEPGAAVASINAQLKKQLPETPQALQDLYACSRQALGSLGYVGDITVVVEPVLWTDGYLVTRTSTETDCGGAYPGSGVESTTWNLKSGQIEDITKWLSAGKITDALKALVRRYSERAKDSDCADALADADNFDMRPGRKGLIFAPELPHVVQACADDIVVPYAALKPFLSPVGAAGAQSMRP